MKKENFVFTVGYKGKYAIVDRTSKKKYSSLNSFSLLDKGFLKFSFCSALYDFQINNVDLENYLVKLREKTSINASLEEFKLLFGVFFVPDVKNFIFI